MPCEIFFSAYVMKVMVLTKDPIFVVITFLQFCDLCYHYTRHILTTYISTKEKTASYRSLMVLYTGLINQ